MIWGVVYLVSPYLLTYAHRSQWSIGHLRPLAIALCSGLLWSFRTSWSLAVSALLHWLASSCCEASLFFSLPLRVPGQGLACGAGCWLPEGVSDPAPLPPQYLLGHWFLSRSLPQIFISESSLTVGFCRCASDRSWRMSGSFVASSVLSAMSHIRRALVSPYHGIMAPGLPVLELIPQREAPGKLATKNLFVVTGMTRPRLDHGPTALDVLISGTVTMIGWLNTHLQRGGGGDENADDDGDGCCLLTV